MYIASAITSFQDLQSWFEQISKHGYWSIYRGNEKKPGERTASITYESVETGWEALQRALAIQTTTGGGLFTIYVANSEKDTSGFTTRFSLAIPLNSFPAIQGQQNQQPENVGAIVEKVVSDRIAAYEKQREIEDLQSEIAELKKNKRNKGIAGILSQIGEVLEENQNLASIVTPIIHGFAAKMLGHDLQPSVAGIHGVTHSVSNDMSAEITEEDKEGQGENYTEDEMDRLAQCMNELSAHFDDPIALLEKFTAFVKRDPATAKSLLTQFLK